MSKLILLLIFMLPSLFSVAAVNAEDKATCTLVDLSHIKVFKHLSYDGTYSYDCYWLVNEFMDKNQGWVLTSMAPDWIFMK